MGNYPIAPVFIAGTTGLAPSSLSGKDHKLVSFTLRSESKIPAALSSLVQKSQAQLLIEIEAKYSSKSVCATLSILSIQQLKISMTDNTLSEEEINTLHRQMADSFIDKANQFAGDNGPENVGMALLFAASRYNSFVVSQHCETLEAYEADLSKAKEFFLAQYAEMLDENLESYKQVYNQYSHLMKQ